MLLGNNITNTVENVIISKIYGIKDDNSQYNERLV